MTTGTLLSTIPVGASTGAVAVSPDGNKVYVVTSLGNLLVIDAATHGVKASIPVGSAGGLRGLSLTSDGAVGYVADWTDNSVAVIDAATQSKSGNIAVGTHPYAMGKFIQKVRYAFNGFFPPVNNLPTVNSTKAGAAVPIKFTLNGDKGLNILAAGAPSSRQTACDGTANVGPVDETQTAGASTLQYDAANAQYTYVWKTEKEWANTCRQFDLTLKDGSSHKAVFQFAR